MSGTSAISIQSLTRRAERMWWLDGLWDFVVAGFMFIVSVWFYINMRVMHFPSWTWPWPFITEEVINPMHAQVVLWNISIIPLGAVYIWVAYKFVSALKSQPWLAERQGNARFPFWLKEQTTYIFVYLAVFLLLFVIDGWLTVSMTGGLRAFSLIMACAPAAAIGTIGRMYALVRYQVVSIVGFILCVVAELFLTTPAVFLDGPRNFFDVPPAAGNPAIPSLVWAGLMLITGVIGLAGVLRKDRVESTL